jgi:hypothetical protein
MDSNSDQIKAMTPDEEDGSARLQQFCDLLGEIERGPDATRRLSQVEAVLKAIAGQTDEEAEAVHKLSEAFSVIEEYAGYLPDRFYRDFADGVNDWTNDAQWQTDPRLCRKILPLLIAKVIRNAEEDE